MWECCSLTVHLRPIDLSSLEHICLHLRDQDKREIYNIRPYDNPMLLAWETWGIFQSEAKAEGTIAWYNGKPAAFIGFVESHPMNWEAMAYGTDAWRSVAIDLMRWGRKTAHGILNRGEGHRLQAESHVDHTTSHKFMEVLGAKQESVVPMRGKDGSTYL